MSTPGIEKGFKEALAGKHQRLSSELRSEIEAELQRRGELPQTCEHDFMHVRCRYAERLRDDVPLKVLADEFYCRKCLEYREVER